MARLDIRMDEGDAIDTIVFANKPTVDEDRSDITSIVNVSEYHPDYLFIEVESTGEYVAVRKTDVGNLIAALEKAKNIWAGVK